MTTPIFTELQRDHVQVPSRLLQALAAGVPEEAMKEAKLDRVLTESTTVVALAELFDNPFAWAFDGTPKFKDAEYTAHFESATHIYAAIFNKTMDPAGQVKRITGYPGAKPLQGSYYVRLEAHFMSRLRYSASEWTIVRTGEESEASRVFATMAAIMRRVHEKFIKMDVAPASWHLWSVADDPKRARLYGLMAQRWSRSLGWRVAGPIHRTEDGESVIGWMAVNPHSARYVVDMGFNLVPVPDAAMAMVAEAREATVVDEERVTDPLNISMKAVQAANALVPSFAPWAMVRRYYDKFHYRGWLAPHEGNTHRDLAVLTLYGIALDAHGEPTVWSAEFGPVQGSTLQGRVPVFSGTAATMAGALGGLSMDRTKRVAAEAKMSKLDPIHNLATFKPGQPPAVREARRRLAKALREVTKPALVETDDVVTVVPMGASQYAISIRNQHGGNLWTGDSGSGGKPRLFPSKAAAAAEIPAIRAQGQKLPREIRFHLSNKRHFIDLCREYPEHTCTLVRVGSGVYDMVISPAAAAESVDADEGATAAFAPAAALSAVQKLAREAGASALSGWRFLFSTAQQARAEQFVLDVEEIGGVEVSVRVANRGASIIVATHIR